ncbi:MarR family transcriptional regulator [Pseudooceanicola sp. CBS1P-1]|uniref:Winged helix DNA-binding protein n=1 Tax=Pseudooceanicola albus TaxID=2692189 RepID=A0A6L7G9D7_9RHOB|nr:MULTISPECIES: MarR family transcriptional regulator [Pseudooceanicola]MBT9384424.1 MarR family transcriptional regulator [Pseudooceanicola endophyticus]MXN20675.1 winged helix DNA-binding protein [Pseudooceanicola albus]
MDEPSRQEELGFQLITVARRYRRIMDGALADFGLTDAAAMPLRVLVRHPEGLRQKDLAERLDIEGPTLVRVLDQLVTMGLVARVEDPQDRRAKQVRVTPRGLALQRDFAAHLDRLRARIFAGTPAEEVEATLRLLTRFEDSLGALRAAQG